MCVSVGVYSRGRGSACFSAPGCCPSTPPPSSRSPLRNSYCTSAVVVMQVMRRETPRAQLAVSCHTLLAAGLLFSHPGKRRSEVKEPGMNLCSVQCLWARLSPPEDTHLYRKEGLCFSLRITTCERTGAERETYG